MASLMRWGRPSIFNLQRDIDDELEHFGSPRGLRREVDRLFGEDLSPRSIWQEMTSLFEDFVSPAPLRHRIRALFEPFGVGAERLGMGLQRGGNVFMPELELIERDNEYLLHIDIPGVRQEDVQISVDDDNVLTIRGERKVEESKRASGYEYTERSYGSFARSIELPRGVDASKIDAEYRDGVLELHIPKTEQAMARQIPIRTRETGRETGAEREPGSEEPRVVGGDGGGAEKRDKRTQANAR